MCGGRVSQNRERGCERERKWEWKGERGREITYKLRQKSEEQGKNQRG